MQQPQAQDRACEAEKGKRKKNKNAPRASVEREALATPRVLTSGLQNQGNKFVVLSHQVHRNSLWATTGN